MLPVSCQNPCFAAVARYAEPSASPEHSQHLPPTHVPSHSYPKNSARPSSENAANPHRTASSTPRTGTAPTANTAHVDPTLPPSAIGTHVPARGPGVLTQYSRTGQSQFTAHRRHLHLGSDSDSTFTQLGSDRPVSGSDWFAHRSSLGAERRVEKQGESSPARDRE